jgi:hypothetical protein
MAVDTAIDTTSCSRACAGGAGGSTTGSRLVLDRGVYTVGLPVEPLSANPQLLGLALHLGGVYMHGFGAVLQLPCGIGQLLGLIMEVVADFGGP